MNTPLQATLVTKKLRLTATLDPAIIAKNKLNLYELAQKNGFMGSFDEFLASFRLELSNLGNLISTNTGNALMLGDDDKLYINPLTKQDW